MGRWDVTLWRSLSTLYMQFTLYSYNVRGVGGVARSLQNGKASDRSK